MNQLTLILELSCQSKTHPKILIKKWSKFKTCVISPLIKQTASIIFQRAENMFTNLNIAYKTSSKENV